MVKGALQAHGIPRGGKFSMAGRIPEQFIQDLLARTDLVDLVDARVPLKRSGGNFMACCPFHNEKTPSFSVSREKQFYYCFGCGAKGTAISFLMEFDRLTFPEAIEVLADAAGLAVPRGSGAGSDRIAATQLLPLYDIQEQACHFYQQQLKGYPTAIPAVDYLRQRGVSGELAVQFRLGYAPPGYQNLPAHWPERTLLAAGLRSAKEPGRSYDWFRDRIIFPIRDRRGRVVGFGGRSLGDGVPKYLNSPETEVFRKHREVYGLYELLQSVRHPEYILVVEGYMDVIALAQFGIRNAVATLGTATSGDQIALLFRYTKHLAFCFDGDLAGHKAAWKALESSLPQLREGRQLQFLRLPEGHDPDSLIRQEGAGAFLQRLQSAPPFSGYFFERLTDGLDTGTIEGRAALIERAKPLIEKLPAGVFRDMIEQQLAALSGYTDRTGQLSPAFEQPRLSRPQRGRPSALRTFLALLVQNPQLVEHIDSAAARKLARLEPQGVLIGALVDYLREHPHITPGGIIEGFRDHAEADVLGRLLAWDTQIAEDQFEATFLDHLRHFTETRTRENRLDSLIEKARHGSLSAEERAELRQLTGH